jgi:integrase
LDDKPPYGLLIRFAAYTGLRRGELAGLDLGHVTLTPPTGTNPEWGGSVRVQVNLKTPNAARTVPLPGWLAEELHGYIGKHPNPQPNTPLWPAYGRSGLDWARRLDARIFYQCHFKPAVLRANLPNTVRMHDLRHTYASLLAAGGTRVEVVAQLMGHADSTTTRSVYTHLWPEHLTDAVAVLAAPPPSTSDNVVPLRVAGRR